MSIKIKIRIVTSESFKGAQRNKEWNFPADLAEEEPE